MMTKTAARGSARERLLAAASELFYAEGVHTVGIDRVIERAGVAKASLYSTFGSKDELIRAYLQQRHEARREVMTERLAELSTPREKILGVFDVLSDSFAKPSYHGCAFVNASAEAPADSPIFEVSDDYRAWLRSVFLEQAQALGAVDAELLTAQLVLLHDGANVSARMDRSRTAARTAHLAAEALVDAAVRG